jgi:hypothetical protein
VKNACSPVANQLDLTAGLDDLQRAKLHRLIVAVRSSRLDAERFEFCNDVLLRFALAFAAGVPAFVLIVGNHLHGVPPRGSVEMFRRLRGAAGGDETQQCQ